MRDHAGADDEQIELVRECVQLVCRWQLGGLGAQTLGRLQDRSLDAEDHMDARGGKLELRPGDRVRRLARGSRPRRPRPRRDCLTTSASPARLRGFLRFEADARPGACGRDQHRRVLAPPVKAAELKADRGASARWRSSAVPDWPHRRLAPRAAVHGSASSSSRRPRLRTSEAAVRSNSASSSSRGDAATRAVRRGGDGALHPYHSPDLSATMYSPTTEHQ